GDEQIRLRDSGSALAWNLVAAGYVDDVNRVVDELAAELRGQVVAAALDKQQIGMKRVAQLLERHQVVADVLSNRGVRAAARFDGPDSFGGQPAVPHQALGSPARHDAVGDDAEAAGGGE